MLGWRTGSSVFSVCAGVISQFLSNVYLESAAEILPNLHGKQKW